MRKDYHIKVRAICPECEKEFFAIRCRVRKGRHIFCSRACAGQSLRVPVIDRFFQNIGKKQTNGCIAWSGGLSADGYGVLSVKKKPRTLRAHRISYEVCIGPIPEGLHVLHRCDNRICVNPLHLFLGTNDDNVADKVAKGRQHARLDKEQAIEIRRRHELGESTQQIATSLGVGKTTIKEVVSRKTWKHV